jgi:hypothetical protein
MTPLKGKPTKQTIWIEVTSRSRPAVQRITAGKPLEGGAARESRARDLTDVKKSAAITGVEQVLPLVKVDLGKSVVIKPKLRAKLGHMKHLGLKLED